MKATWNGVVLAQSERTEIIEGNHYFPPEALDRRWLRESDTRTSCPLKGQAFYLDVVVGDVVNEDAAWYYPEPLEAARSIRGHVAFWRGVEVLR